MRVCLRVQVLGVCVRLSDNPVTSALRPHRRRRRHECLRGILRAQGVTGCVTARGVATALAVICESLPGTVQTQIRPRDGEESFRGKNSSCDGFKVWSRFMWFDIPSVLVRVNDGG